MSLYSVGQRPMWDTHTRARAVSYSPNRTYTYVYIWKLCSNFQYVAYHCVSFQFISLLVLSLYWFASAGGLVAAPSAISARSTALETFQIHIFLWSSRVAIHYLQAHTHYRASNWNGMTKLWNHENTPMQRSQENERTEFSRGMEQWVHVRATVHGRRVAFYVCVHSQKCRYLSYWMANNCTIRVSMPQRWTMHEDKTYTSMTLVDNCSA